MNGAPEGREAALRALRSAFREDGGLSADVEADALAYMAANRIEPDHPLLKGFVDLLRVKASIAASVEDAVARGIERGRVDLNPAFNGADPQFIASLETAMQKAVPATLDRVATAKSRRSWTELAVVVGVAVVITAAVMLAAWRFGFDQGTTAGYSQGYATAVRQNHK